MKVKCVICDKIETIKDDTFQAKRLRNKPISTYMCDSCSNRIKFNTEKRIESGNFHLYQSRKRENTWD